jgi:hypothetical protein
LISFGRKLVALRQTIEGAAKLSSINRDIGRGKRFAIEGFLDDLERALLFEGDDIADFAEIARNVDLLAIHGDVTVIDKLTSSGASAGEAHPVDEVIEAALQDAEEGKTSDGLIFLSDHEETTELTLIDAVEFLELLFLKQLGAVFGSLPLAILTMLARAISSLFELIAGLKHGETEMARLLPFRISVP